MSLTCDTARRVLETNGYMSKCEPISSRSLRITGITGSLFIGMCVAETACRDHHIESWSASGLAFKCLGALIGLAVALFVLGLIKELDRSAALFYVKSQKAVNFLDDHYPKGSNAVMSLDHVKELKEMTEGVTHKMLGLT